MGNKRMAATVITIAVEKGGCGKTVTTSNLAYLMGDEGKKVLCLDTDPQGNLTFALTGGNAITSKAFANRSLYDMIDGFRYNTQTRDFIVESEYENVDLIPANDQTPRLSKRLEDLYTDAQRDYDRGDPKYLASDTDVLDYFLRQVKDKYDYILIDCSPSLGLITVNALTAADSVMIPVQCEYFALEGISKLLNTIKIIKSKLNPALEIEGFLLTMYDSRLRLANQIYEEVKRPFRDLVFTTVIQRNVKLSEASSYGKPVLLYDAESKGALNHMQLAQELIDKNK